MSEIDLATIQLKGEKQNFILNNKTFKTGSRGFRARYTHGTYSPKLRVTDNNGLTDETSITILVREHPVADFTWDPPSPQVCETVTFDGSASTPDGGVIVSWDWDFGDTTGARAPRPSATSCL